ncbi:MAG TPA: hypothetical protein IGS40_17225 [Trichormus sp. M33_DOE_039]|nr:hypothetical protein [Trichormus sp. M33_DOE_039]
MSDRLRWGVAHRILPQSQSTATSTAIFLQVSTHHRFSLYSINVSTSE